MKIIIAGSRDIHDLEIVKRAFVAALAVWGKRLSDVQVIISGRARGVDRLGEQLAALINCEVIAKEPDWNKYGKQAGWQRNNEMAKLCTPGVDGLVAVRLNNSPGTTHMITIAQKRGLLVAVTDLISKDGKVEFGYEQ